MYSGAIFCLILMFILYLPLLILLSYVFSFAFNNYQSAQAILVNLYLWVSATVLLLQLIFLHISAGEYTDCDVNIFLDQHISCYVNRCLWVLLIKLIFLGE